MFKNTIIAISLLMLALAGSAQSAIGNGPPNQTGGSDLNSFLEGDNFSLGSATSLSQVTYWSLQTGPADYAGTTSWSINSDAAGAPGASLFSGSAVASSVATGNTTLGLNEFKNTFSLSVALAPGNYWLVLHNGPNGSDPGTQYYWAWSSNVGDSQSMFQGDPNWSGNAAELAFQLAAVPDAGGTLALLSIALGAVVFMQGVRRRAPESN